MPGIAGIISPVRREENKRDLGLMVSAMTHEAGYQTGIYVNEDLGLYAGWVCHEGSFSDCMPLMNQGKDLVLIYTGENFPDSSAISRLKGKGGQDRSCKAGYLLDLYEDDEGRFLDLLNGWFSGLLVDLRKKTAVLFNDRYGMERVYYSESADQFIFSSEAKALLKVRPDLRRIDPEALGHYFAWNCVFDCRTLFSDIHLLPGGSQWVFSGDHLPEKERYFQVSTWEQKPSLKEEEFYQKLKETFQTVVPRYFQGQDAIAMSVSAGLDTRLVMAYSGVPRGDLPCHTFAGVRRATLDGILGRELARECGQPHEFLYLDREFLSRFPELAQKTVYVTDGCHDVNGTYDIYLNKLVRNIGPVRMTGKFGSEIVRSRSMLHKPYSFLPGFFHKDFEKYISRSMVTMDEAKKGRDLTFAAFKEMPWNEFGRLAVERSMLTMRSPFMDNHLVELMYQAPEGVRDSDDLSLRLIEDANPDLLKIMTDSGTAGNLIYPFSRINEFYHDVLVKSEYGYLFMLPHWLAPLDRILSPLRPERLLAGRHQLGYQRLWFRDECPEFIKDVLLDHKTMNRPFFNRKFIEEMTLRHTKGTGNYTGEINKALTVELIHRQLVEEI
jgi:asparagine synthase (glutamine-hydrolysing)